MRLARFYLSSRGRLGRRLFWLGGLLPYGLSMALCLWLDALSGAAFPTWTVMGSLLWAWPQYALQARRWHDRNRSARWILVNVVPVIGWFWAFIETALLTGTRGSNRYGWEPDIARPNPLAAGPVPSWESDPRSPHELDRDDGPAGDPGQASPRALVLATGDAAPVSLSPRPS